mmetsp:Transcript_6144/g.18471  ORF Transcript_6144/g.18471 Transcript_6144/m.18471 type:complete len:148 (-) Transcript_6144:359-802(-)
MIVIVLNRSLYALKLLSNLVINHPADCVLLLMRQRTSRDQAKLASGVVSRLECTTSPSAYGFHCSATGGSATSAAILFSSAKHETYTSTGLWIRSCASSRAAGGHTTYACVCHAHAASRNAPPAALSTRCARGDGAASRHRATCALR